MGITVNEWLFYYLTDEEKYSLFKLPKQRDVVKNFFRKFYPFNSDKTLLIEEDSLQNLPSEIINILPHKETDKDIYLLQTCLITDDKIILTTDEDFKKAIHNKFGIKVKLVSDFLKELKNARK